MDPLVLCSVCGGYGEVNEGGVPGLCHKCNGTGYGVDMSTNEEKANLTGLFRDNPETPEGKYLVKRRDGTIPPWPSFVLGGADPHAEIALRAYATSCAGDPTIDKGFVAALFRWADEFKKWRELVGVGDPGKGKHRKDDPAILEEMKKGRSA